MARDAAKEHVKDDHGGSEGAAVRGREEAKDGKDCTTEEERSSLSRFG